MTGSSLRSLWARAASSRPAPHAGDDSSSQAAFHREPGSRATPADDCVPYGLQVAAGVAWRIIVIAVAAWGAGLVLAATSTVAIPVAVAILLTALALPLTTLLRRRARMGRHLAAAITTLGGLALVIGLLGVAGNQLVKGFSDLSGKIGDGVEQIRLWLTTGPFQVGNDQMNQAITAGQDWVKSHSATLTSGAVSAGTTASELLVGTIIALIVMFFFLAEGDTIWAWFVRLLPRHLRTAVHEGFRRGWVSLGSYVRTQMLVAFIDAFFIAIGALVLGLPLIVPLALIIFFASAVPIVGAVVSGALAVVLALVVKGPMYALIMLAIIVAVQQIESHLLQPLLMGRAVALHPLAVLLGIAVFSYLFGIVGALFAVPIMAVTNTVVLYWTGHDKFPALAAKPITPRPEAPPDASLPAVAVEAESSAESEATAAPQAPPAASEAAQPTRIAHPDEPDERTEPDERAPTGADGGAPSRD